MIPQNTDMDLTQSNLYNEQNNLVKPQSVFPWANTRDTFRNS